MKMVLINTRYGSTGYGYLQRDVKSFYVKIEK